MNLLYTLHFALNFTLSSSLPVSPKELPTMKIYFSDLISLLANLIAHAHDGRSFLNIVR